jgi:AraC family transcriptional regulator
MMNFQLIDRSNNSWVGDRTNERREDEWRRASRARQIAAIEISTHAERTAIATTLTSLLAGAVDALDHDRPSSRLLLQQAIAVLNRTGLAGSKQDLAVRRSTLASWQEKRVVDYISSHLNRPLALHELANVARLSNSHFSRAFKGTFGQPPHTFIMARRIDLARKKMLSSSAPLSQIALACGFADQAHLGRLFRRAMGLAPSQWRRAHQPPPDQSMVANPPTHGITL